MTSEQAYEIGDVIGEGVNALEVTEIRRDGNDTILSYGMRLHSEVEQEREQAREAAAPEETNEPAPEEVGERL